MVVTGGDGTIDNAASSPLGNCTSLGVVRRGTVNCFARSHGIPFDAPSGIGMLLNAQAHPVQAGKVNERAFLVNASPGMSRDLLEAQVNAMRAMKRCETAGKILPPVAPALPNSPASRRRSLSSRLGPHAACRSALGHRSAHRRRQTRHFAVADRLGGNGGVVLGLGLVTK